MALIAAIVLFIVLFLGLIIFIQFCDWVLSRREINS